MRKSEITKVKKWVKRGPVKFKMKSNKERPTQHNLEALQIFKKKCPGQRETECVDDIFI